MQDMGHHNRWKKVDQYIYADIKTHTLQYPVQTGAAVYFFV